MGWIVKERKQSEHERELGKRLNEQGWLVSFAGVWDLPNVSPKEREWWRVRAQKLLGNRIVGVCTNSSEADLSLLAELSKLQRISGSPRNTASLAPIAGLTDLVTVSVARSQVSDLTPLEGLQHLTYLNLNAINITDITPLGKLKRLERLLLAWTQVKDLTATGRAHESQRTRHRRDTSLRSDASDWPKATRAAFDHEDTDHGATTC